MSQHHPYHPIIYVRGSADSQGEVEKTVADERSEEGTSERIRRTSSNASPRPLHIPGYGPIRRNEPGELRVEHGEAPAAFAVAAVDIHLALKERWFVEYDQVSAGGAPRK